MSVDHLKKPEGVLFDLDGTLLDTAPDLGAALNHVLQTLGYPEKTYEEYRVESSNGSIGMLKMGLGNNFSEENEATLRQQFLDHYESNISEGTTFFAGIVELLAYLDEAQIPWGVVTNKPAHLTEKLLKDFREFETCGVCFCGDTFEHRKPHPEPLIKAAEAIDVKCQDIWYVGDAPRDMEAASAAGMVNVLARYGYLTEEELNRHWDVDIQVEKAKDLLEVIINSSR